MDKEYIDRRNLSAFSDLVEKLAYNQEYLIDYINHPYSIQTFEKSFESRKPFPEQQRLVLASVLKEQYGHKFMEVATQVELLMKSSTFTVTTGHQLNLFTGPLYFLYKIAHTIKLSRELKLKYPDKDFVPIYWMATEDHDFEEINHFSLFGRKIEWSTAQNGPVGMFDLENWQAWQAELIAMMPNDADRLNALFSNYQGKDLAEATRNFVHHLFGKYGLVILDANHRELKKYFRKTMAKDVMSNFSFHQVSSTNERLEKDGLKTQVFPRPINLFFIEKGKRERLVPTDGKIAIEGKGEFTPIEMLDLIDSRPELFSPNVVLRPLYQETILPNLAYVGGGGELAYWLQLKGVFDAVEQPFPLLCLRNSIHLLDDHTAARMQEFDMNFVDFQERIEDIKKSYVLRKGGDELDFNDVDVLIDQLEQSIIFKAEQTDASLVGMAAGEITRLRKSIDAIRGRLIKAEKQRFEQDLKRLEKIKNKLFPNDGLQEREDNFLTYYLNYDGDFIASLIAICEPFNMDFMVVKLHE